MASVPATAPPAPRRAAGAAASEVTVTLVTLPWVAVTVMPAAGSASRLPFDGVIFRSAAACAAFADAEAEADAEAWAGGLRVPAAGRGEQAEAAAAATLTYVRARLPRTANPPRGSGVGERPYYVLLPPRRRSAGAAAELTAQPRAATAASTSTYSGHAPTRSASVR